ncbi:MAG: DsbC family protein [Xanthomonadales bacterium]|nr:DsbC family protein [Xanthomonadales bacterium]
MTLRMIAWVAAFCALTQTAVADDASREAIRKSLSELVPNSRIGRIEATAFPGMFEVTVDDSTVLYVSSDGNYILQGALFDARNKKNLTDVRQASLRKELMASIPVKDRIVFTPKDGKVKHRVAVFTDVDCGYCRKLHHEMADFHARGIEVQYLAWPRGGPGSDTWRKHVAVYCAKDRQDAFTQAKEGVDPGHSTCANPVEREFQLGVKLGLNGTPAIVLEDGTLMQTYMPAADLEAQLQTRQSSAR